MRGWYPAVTVMNLTRFNLPFEEIVLITCCKTFVETHWKILTRFHHQARNCLNSKKCDANSQGWTSCGDHQMNENSWWVAFGWEPIFIYRRNSTRIGRSGLLRLLFVSTSNLLPDGPCHASSSNGLLYNTFPALHLHWEGGCEAHISCPQTFLLTSECPT